MTAYLKPGDKIHLAMTIGAGTLEAREQETRKLKAELTAFYAEQGVELLMLTTTSTSATIYPPTVVAVFRAE